MSPRDIQPGVNSAGEQLCRHVANRWAARLPREICILVRLGCLNKDQCYEATACLLLVVLPTPVHMHRGKERVHLKSKEFKDTSTHGGCCQPMCDPEGCATVLRVVEGGGLVDPNLRGRRVGRSATGLPGGGGGGRWVPQHTYLKMIPMTH